MKKICLAVVLSLIVSSTFAGKDHSASDYILFKGDKDTTFCRIHEMGGSGALIGVITYTPEGSDQRLEIKGPDQIAKIISLRCGGFVMDYVPTNPEKPNGRGTLMYTSNPGKVRYYDDAQIIAKEKKDGERELFIKEFSAMYYIVRLENGETYKTSKDNVYKIILPELKKCKAFNEKYKEPEKVTHYAMIANAIAVYNKLCK